MTSSNRTLGNDPKLHWRRVGLDIRKSFFTERMVRHWKALQGGGELPSLGRHGISWFGLLGMVAFCQRLDLMILWVFSNLNNAVTLWLLLHRTNRYRPLKNPIALLESWIQSYDKIQGFLRFHAAYIHICHWYPLQKPKTLLILGGGYIYVEGKHEPITVHKMFLIPKRL